MSTNTAVLGGQGEALISSGDLDRIESIAGLGDGFKNIRHTAYSRVLAHPFPTSADELWRYTKPEGFRFSRLLEQEATQFSLAPFAAGGETPGLTIISGHDALAKIKELMGSLFGDKNADLNNDALASLQLATVSSLACVVVPRGYSSTTPIRISQVLPAQASSSSLLIILCERGSSSVFVEELTGAPAGLIAPRVEVLVGDGAEATFCSVQKFASNVTYYARHRFHTGRDSKLSSMHLALGGKLSRVDIDLKMYEPGALADLVGVYLVDGNRHADLHPTQYHLAPHCRSDLFTKGVLRDTARSVYYGYIKVAEGAQKTDAYQTNRNLLLSQSARADSIPNLEIKANDVRCSHGASVSSVSTEDMFYLMARGLSRPTAEELLVEGFLEELLTRVKNPTLHEWLSTEVSAYNAARVKA